VLGSKCHLVILDDFTHYLWTFPLKLKSDTFTTLSHFFAYVSTQFGRAVNAIQCDNEREFDNSSTRFFLLSNGTQLRMSCPYMSPQNGKVERIIYSINNVITHKLHADGTLDRYKARWVLQGFTQHPGVDYNETFSPVVKPVTVRKVLATTVSRTWLIQQLNVKNAFLHGTLSETVFCCQPTGFTDPAHPDLVCHLHKSLYGLKQAPRAWYSRFATYLTTLGFIEAKSDTSLFIFCRDLDMIYLLLYVDDIILTTSSTELLRHTIFALQREFVMKDLG
jgi:hypothetical protein